MFLMTRINVKLDVIESMLFFWKATSEREKVGEAYMAGITDYDVMKHLYQDEFDAEAAREVLSAISNRELLNTTSKKSRKFWNNNMWMMEDLEYTDMMVAPLKQLNLDDVAEELTASGAPETIEVHFIPGHHDVYYKDENKVIINFFRVKPDLMDDSIVTIEDQPLKEYVADRIKELV